MNNNEHYMSSGSEAKAHLRRTGDDFDVLAESTSFLSRVRLNVFVVGIY
jgi:hypothetical protein